MGRHCLAFVDLLLEFLAFLAKAVRKLLDLVFENRRSLGEPLNVHKVLEVYARLNLRVFGVGLLNFIGLNICITKIICLVYLLCIFSILRSVALRNVFSIAERFRNRVRGEPLHEVLFQRLFGLDWVWRAVRSVYGDLLTLFYLNDKPSKLSTHVSEHLVNITLLLLVIFLQDRPCPLFLAHLIQPVDESSKLRRHCSFIVVNEIVLELKYLGLDLARVRLLKCDERVLEQRVYVFRRLVIVPGVAAQL